MFIFVPVESEQLEVQLGLYDQQWLVKINTNMYTQVPHHNLQQKVKVPFDNDYYFS